MKVAYQERIESAARKALSQNSLYASISTIIDELENDAYAWDVRRHLASGYCQWRISLEPNEYIIGNELATQLKKECYLYTHDEDREFFVNDFNEQIENACILYAYNFWCEH